MHSVSINRPSPKGSFRAGFSIVSVALFLLAAGCSHEGASPSGTGRPGIPEANLSASISGETVHITVAVPPGHHAYLNAGDDGNLIPITFYWKSLVEKGILHGTPALQSSPKGIRDADFKAQVLRGTGSFVFKTKEATALQDKSLQVRVQICDEQKGICYRPVDRNLLL